MIVREFYATRKDGVSLYRTYSDEGFYILQNETQIEYDEAIDVEGAPYSYCETDKPIDESGEDNPEEATEQDYINALAELGVTDDEENNA